MEDLELIFGKDQPTQQLRAIVPQMVQASFRRFIKEESKLNFFVTRHPFTRLVSAFRDKFERYDRKYYPEMGLGIVERYRKEAEKRFAPSDFRNGTDVEGREVRLPHFWEFVQHVKEAKDDPFLLDEHFRPVSKICSVCYVEYDFILRFENMAEEERLFAEVIGYDQNENG